jgi:hypothetical protein
MLSWSTDLKDTKYCTLIQLGDCIHTLLRTHYQIKDAKKLADEFTKKLDQFSNNEEFTSGFTFGFFAIEPSRCEKVLIQCRELLDMSDDQVSSLGRRGSL